MPRNPRRVAFNFQKRSKKREARPNVFSGPVPTASGAVESTGVEREPARNEAAVSRMSARRASGRARARSVVYSEFLRQELLKFGAVTLVLVVGVIVVAVLYK